MVKGSDPTVDSRRRVFHGKSSASELAEDAARGAGDEEEPTGEKGPPGGPERFCRLLGLAAGDSPPLYFFSISRHDETIEPSVHGGRGKGFKM